MGITGEGNVMFVETHQRKSLTGNAKLHGALAKTLPKGITVFWGDALPSRPKRAKFTKVLEAKAQPAKSGSRYQDFREASATNDKG